MKSISASGATEGTSSRIQVRNLQRKMRVNMAALQRFASRALKVCSALPLRRGHSRDLPNEIFVLLISDRRMAGLHQRFLTKSGSTDVITFRHGEIFISVPTAHRQAREFGTSAVREIELYIVHGLLHLRGLDDKTSRARDRMRAAEATVLRRADCLK